MQQHIGWDWQPLKEKLKKYIYISNSYQDVNDYMKFYCIRYMCYFSNGGMRGQKEKWGTSYQNKDTLETYHVKSIATAS